MANKEYLSGSVQLLDDLPVNSAFLEEVEEVVLPAQAGENEGQIDFFIPTKNLFTANKFLLQADFTVRKIDDAGAEAAVAATDNVAMVPLTNLLAYKAITLDINGEPVERYNSYAGYKSFFKFIAGHSKDWLMKNKYRAHFYPDSASQLPGSMRALTDAFKNRRSHIVGRGPALETYLPFDVCASRKLYPPGTSFKISLFHNSDSWRLQVDPTNASTFKLKVSNPRLIIWRYILHKDVIENFRKCFSFERPIVYDFQGMEAYGPFLIPKESTTFTQQIRYGKRPNVIYLFFVEASAASGALKTNSLYFEHMGITECQASFGSKSVPEQGLKTQFTSTDPSGPLNIYDAHRAFINSLGLGGQASFIGGNEFVNGYTFFTFKFAPVIFSSQYKIPEIDTIGDLTVTLKRPPSTNVMHMFAFVVEQRSLFIRPNNTAELKLL